MRSDDCSIEASGLKVGLKKICQDRPEQSDARTHRRGGARAQTRNISKAKGPTSSKCRLLVYTESAERVALPGFSVMCMYFIGSFLHSSIPLGTIPVGFLR